MKNTLLTVLFIFVLGQTCHWGLPWWGLAPIAGLAGYLFPQSAGRSLWAGFLGGFLLWVVAALWLDVSNEGLLSGKIGQLFLGLSRWHILLMTGVLGGLVGGLACLTGRWAGDLFSNPAHSSKKSYM